MSTSTYCRNRSHALTSGVISLTFWLYAFATTVYLINRMPKVVFPLVPLLKSCSTQLLTHPNFVSSVPYSSYKLDPKSSPCVFLGYFVTQSVFLCFDPILNKIFVSRHVKFMENVFSFVSPPTSTTPVVDTDSTLPASLFTPSDYLALLTLTPSPTLPPSELHLTYQFRQRHLNC